MRRFLFKNTVTEEVLVLPVTPGGYRITHGHQSVQVDMHGTGPVNLPGEAALLDETIEGFFPARAYPFNQPEASTDPFVPLETLEKWSDAGDPVRFIVSDTPVNALVLLDPITYQERDGTRDIYFTLRIRGYRILAAPITESEDTGNAQRAVETEPAHAASYTVQKGDSLSAIARRVYGDASLYGRLAAANAIANPNLIYPGQVLSLPDVEALPAAVGTSGGSLPVAAKAAAETQAVWKAAAMGPAADYAGGWELEVGNGVKNLAQELLKRSGR